MSAELIPKERVTNFNTKHAALVWNFLCKVKKVDEQKGREYINMMD